MPLFDTEENRLADSIGESDLTIYLHTQSPTNANKVLGRINKGGGKYENGAIVRAADISIAANGDIRVTVLVDFGEADENIGNITHWSGFRGAAPVGFGPTPVTLINAGDRFQINENQIQFNGSSS